MARGSGSQGVDTHGGPCYSPPRARRPRVLVGASPGSRRRRCVLARLRAKVWVDVRGEGTVGRGREEGAVPDRNPAGHVKRQSERSRCGSV